MFLSDPDPDVFVGSGSYIEKRSDLQFGSSSRSDPRPIFARGSEPDPIFFSRGSDSFQLSGFTILYESQSRKAVEDK